MSKAHGSARGLLGRFCCQGNTRALAYVAAPVLAAGAIWAPHAFTGATVTVPAGSVITGVYTQQSAVLGDSLAGHLSAGDICVQTGTVVAFGHRQGTYACFAN